MESNSRFVNEKLALLNDALPVSAAETEAAWLGVRERLAVRRPSRWRWLGALAAGALIAVMAMPSTRGLAQSVWKSFRLGRPVSIEIDWERTTPNLLLPNVVPFYAQERPPVRAASEAAASEVAGYRVRTLAGGEWRDPVSRVVVTPPVVRRRIEIPVMEADLRRLGRVLPTVPAGLAGADVELVPGGKEVISRFGRCPELVGPWRACAMLVQSRPWRLQLPPQVSLDAYTRFSLELAGLEAAEVDRLVELTATGPALHLPTEGKATVRRVSTRGTEATLVVYETAASGETAYLLRWEEDGFWFSLFGRGPEGAVALAETVR